MHRKWFSPGGLLFALTIAGVGCTGQIDAGIDSGGPGQRDQDPDDGTIDEPAGPDGPAEDIKTDTNCQIEGAPVVAPLRRLTPAEYENTVRDLFGGLDLPEAGLPADTVIGGFDNQASGQAVSPLLVEKYNDASESIAELAVQNLNGWSVCGDENLDCAQQLGRDLAMRAFRRPLQDDEVQRFDEFLATNVDEFGFTDAVVMFTQAVLLSPDFLYRPEFGAGDVVDGRLQLSGYEMATRLSYLLWRTMPDPELFEAAESGELDDVDGVLTQARRLFGDQRARSAVADVHRQWFGTEKLAEVELAPDLFPRFEDMRADLQTSVERYVEDVFWGDGSLKALLTGTHGFVNDNLAEVFGVQAPGSDDLVRVELDPTQRGGLLTQPGLLASTSHGIRHSPILRGLFLMDSALCVPIPSPPVDVNAAIDEIPEGVARTTREHLEQTHSGQTCRACHDMIDGLGFSFEHYDAIGAYRDTERGVAINAQADLTSLDGLSGTADNGIELGTLMADSEQVHACVANHWFRYALGRKVGKNDSCLVEGMGQRLGEDDDLQALVFQLVLSDAFRSTGVQ